MKRTLQHPFIHLIVGIIAFLLLYFNASFFNTTTTNYKAFNANLNQKESLANQTLDELMTNDSSVISFNKSYAKLNKQKGLSFYVIENNELTYWSNRSVDFSIDLNEFTKNNGLVQLQNGWYQYLLKKSNRKTYLALILIKHNYAINNKYLKNNFHQSFEIANNQLIYPDKEYSVPHPILNNNGAFLFGLAQNPDTIYDNSSYNNWILLLIFFIGFILIVSFISKQCRKTTVLRKYSPIIVIIFIALSRLFFLYFYPFTSLFEQELFSPTIFAQSAFLPSLGDLIISTVLFALIIYYLSQAIQKVNPNNKIIVFIIVLASAISPLILADLLQGLITNSKINFDINYLLDLNDYSFAGIGSITLLFIGLILFVKISINHFIDNAFKRNHIITIFWVINLLFVIIGHFFLGISAFLTSWILFVIIAFSFKSTPKTSFYRSVFLVLIISITTSYGFIHLGKEKEQVNKEFIAKKLAKERDPVTEYLFENSKEKIETDSTINNSTSNYFDHKEKNDKYILNRYFGGYYSKYDVNIIGFFNPQDSIYVNDKPVHCFSFFDDKIAKETDDPFRINKSFNFLYSDEGGSSYLAKINLKNSSDSIKWSLFIEFTPKKFSKAEGYPELLLNEKDITKPINTNTYSFAKYKKGKLIDNSGKFNYSIELNDKYKFNDDGFVVTTYDNAYHIIYQSDKNTSIILSSPQKTIFNYITTFSYFFIISSILVLIIGLFFKISPFNWQLALTDFSTKIQLFIIASIFLSFILFALGTSYYIKKQYLEKNKTQLAEKVQSVLIELEHKLGDQKELTLDFYDEMTYYLVKFSNVFYTDINLYDKTGTLLATSRPEVFERGLTSKQMNPEAYNQIHTFKKSNFTHSENIGELSYISTYVPFRNEKHKILAYMNLPYFAKQNELENELSSFYTALINIYGLLFLISTIIAVFFANYISEPVRMIKNKISALQLGQSYDLLEWESNDEIGALVFEYNKKVLELEKSATRLIKSERESAWREMAKQVAHEIKNPLTPMKLSVQQLQRVSKDNPEDLNERIERTAKTLVEQIDTLTKIADEFSNFAKMPQAEVQEINLIPIIETTIDLYKEENVHFSFHEKCNGTVNVVADKDQFHRVFNNLIKNAIQAMPENSNGQISVLLTQEPNNYIIEVKDNGVGIPKDKKDKIFVPNFTTKSTGMGLGLAMVKNIINNANGEIWFETTENIGTSFFISLPIKR